MQRQHVSIIELDRFEAILMKDKYFIIELKVKYQLLMPVHIISTKMI